MLASAAWFVCNECSKQYGICNECSKQYGICVLHSQCNSLGYCQINYINLLYILALSQVNEFVYIVLSEQCTSTNGVCIHYLNNRQILAYPNTHTDIMVHVAQLKRIMHHSKCETLSPYISTVYIHTRTINNAVFTQRNNIVVQ